MTRKLLAMITASLVMTFMALPAHAQEAPKDTTVDGVFRLTLNGEVPDDFSFYVETDQAIGGLAPICTTDAAMVAEGYTECVGGGAVNELPFNVPQGATVQYRILGSQGTGLSQMVVAEGETVAETDGFTIDASHSFDGSPSEPTETPGTVDDQYSDEAPAEDATAPTASNGGMNGGTNGGTNGETNVETNGGSSEATSGEASDIAELHGGILPDTGGASVVLLFGAALILSAGGFLAYRAIR